MDEAKRDGKRSGRDARLGVAAPQLPPNIKHIINSVADPIFVKDRQHRWVLLNDAYCRLMGYSLNELLGKSDYDFFPKAEADVFWQKDEEVFRSRVENVNEERFTDASGVTHTIVTKKTLYHDPQGEEYIVGVIRDITDIKRMEIEVEGSRRYLDKIINSVADPIFVKDRQHRWVLLNDALCKFMGYERTMLIGKSDYDFFPKAEADVFWQKDEEVFRSRVENVNEERFTDASGVTHTIVTKKTLYRDSDLEEYIVGVIRDITEKKRLEMKLEDARLSLEAKVSERTRELKSANVKLREEISQREVIEKALRESEERFRRSFEDANIGMAQVSKDDRFLNVNKSLCLMLGYGRQELLGRSFVSITHPDDIRLSSDFMKKLVSGEMDSGKIEKRYITKAGDTVWAIVNVSSVRESRTKKLMYFITQFQNITERKMTEDALRDSERRYRQLVELAPDGIVVHSGGIVLLANKAAIKIVGGKSDKDLVGRRLMDFVHPDYVVLVKERIRCMSVDGETMPTVEEKFLRLDGSAVDVEVAAMPMQFGKKPSMQVIFRDITGRKRSEEALAMSEEKYRTLAESAEDFIFSVDGNGRILYVNGVAADEIGRKPKDLVGLNLRDIFPRKQYLRNLQGIRRVIRTGRPLYSEWTAHFPKRSVWLSTWLTPIRDGNRKISSVLGVSRDITEMKAARDALAESEMKYKTLIDTVPHAVAIFQDNKVAFANQAGMRMFGFRQHKDFLDSDILDYVASSERGRLGRYSRQRQTHGKNPPKHYLTTMRRSSGQEFPAELYIRKTTYRGKPATQALIIDITEKVKADSALRESERKYRSTINSMRDAIHMVDRSLRFILWNKTMVKWNKRLGLQVELSGRTVPEVFPFLPKKVWGEYRRVFRTGKPLTVEDTVVIAGRELVTETTKIPVFEAGRVHRVITVIRDITRAKMAERKVLDIKTHLETILDGISESIVVIDHNYNIVSYNRAFQDWVKKPRLNCIGRKCHHVMHDFERSCRDCVVREVFRTGRPSESIHSHNRHGGRVYHEVRAYPIPQEDGITEAIYIFRDVTEREQLKEQLALNYGELLKANKELMTLDRMKSEFLAVASHELRTPLAIIRGYADILSCGDLGEVLPQQKEKLMRIVGNAEQLNTLVNNILDLTRIEAGEFNLVKEGVDIGGLVAETVEDMTGLARKKRIRLSVNLQSRRKIQADRGRIRQVLVNLMDNSLKFTPDGGSVKLTVTEAAGRVAIRVRDSGIGIRRRDMDGLFQRFRQLDSSVHRRYKGVGLGLVICKSIVELHGGSITVESRFGRWTAFTVRLPYS